MGEDFLSYACIKRAQTIKVIDIQPYHYRVRQSSIVHKRTEYEQYHALFVYLTRLIEGYEYARPLFVQCVYYMLSLIDASKVVLFPILTKEDRVVVYGKGVMGKSMLQGLQEQQACQIVNWVDSSSIDELIEMSSESYDYILIAITGHELVRKIEQLICDKGIDSKKIMRIHPKDLQEENLPEDIKKIIQLEDF